MVKEDIETVIDKLYDFVKAGNKVPVREAALALSLTEEQVEKLALILEESDLIEVQYTLAGSVLIPKKVEQQVPMIPFAPSGQAKENEVLEDVKSVENVAEFIEKDFVERLSKAEKALSVASSGKDLTKKNIEEIRKELAFLHQRLKNFQVNVKKIELGEVSFEQQLLKYQAKLAELEKTGRFKESAVGKKSNPSEFLSHFLAFLMAWIQVLISSAKKTQAEVAAKSAARKEEAKTVAKARPETAIRLPAEPSVRPTAKPKPRPKKISEAKPKVRKAGKRLAGERQLKARQMARKTKAKSKKTGRRK